MDKQLFLQPSSFAGYAGIFQALKFLFPAYAPILDGLTALASGVAVFKSERQ